VTVLAGERTYFPGGALRLDGAALRDRMIAEIRARVTAAGEPAICLASVVDGDDAPSVRYVGMKHRAAARAGLHTRGTELSAGTSQAEAEDLVDALVADPGVGGILVQLPLPAGLDGDRVIDRIDPAKDVDGLTLTNLGRLVRGTPGLVPATALAVLRLLDAYGVPLAGRRVTIVGRTPLVGIPLSLLLGGPQVGASVVVCATDDPDLTARCREADVVISDASIPHLIGAERIAPGATVVDIGASWPEGTLVGDVDTDGVTTIAGALAPNPGGAGPMTVACLLENTLRTAGLAAGLGRDDGTAGGGADV
jgi:methylenetetrahydrofolate dehydrogenase (NADP+)/methenyltetrahydrofolate cyclohydrolase